jgi:proliferating cell nuclear antigen
MGRRGRKPKVQQPTEEKEEPKVVKKRGRRSKKQPTILDIINNDEKTKDKLEDEIATIKFNEEFSEESSSEEDSEDNNQYLLELKTLQTTTFKSLIEALKEILVEANIECSKTGMRIIARDAKKGILVYLQLYAKRFEYYKCKKKVLHMGISMYNFHKLIKNLNNNSTLTLFVEQHDLNRLGIVIENNERKTTTTYHMKLLDIDVNTHEFNTKNKVGSVICMSASMFQKICREMYNLSDKISIMVYKNNLTLACNVDTDTDEIASQETVISESPEYMRFLVSSDEVIEGVYSLKDIIAFTKCSNISGGGAMKLYLDNNLPLVIEYDVGDLGNMKLCICRLDTNEDES